MSSEEAPRAGARCGTALVYPPFGPAGIASLGLAQLSAGLKRRGLPCRVFHWNLEYVTAMPGDTPRERALAYHELSGRLWFPFNEWIFSEVLHDRHPRDDDTLAGLLAADRSRGATRVGAPDILRLRHQAHQTVAAMAERLVSYEIVGIASTFYQNVAALALAREVKRRNPSTTVVLGGANCDGEMGSALMELFPFLDHVFVGEADHGFPDFVERISRGCALEGIPGLVSRADGGGVVKGPAALPVTDLDVLPYPDFDDYVRDRRRAGLDDAFDLVLPLESSRGCWWGAKQHCTFCGLNALGMEYRQKRWDRFRDEIQFVTDRYGARFLFMADNIMSMRYYEEFMAWAEAAGPEVDFFYEIKANVGRRHVEKLTAARISAVQPGIESFSTELLRLMRKGTTGIQNVALLKYARELGLLLSYNVLVGFPGESAQAYERMCDQLPLLEHLQPPSGVPRVEYHRFSPYQADPAAFGLTLRPDPRYRWMHPFGDEDLERICYQFVDEQDVDSQPGHVARLAQEVRRWSCAYRVDECSLTWTQQGSDIVVADRRRAFGDHRYRLRGYAVDVFRALDRPAALGGVMRETASDSSNVARSLLDALFTASASVEDDEEVVEFTRHEFAADHDLCLKPLIDRGLLWVEPDEDAGRVRYLALPVHENWRRVESRWLEIGI